MPTRPGPSFPDRRLFLVGRDHPQSPRQRANCTAMGISFLHRARTADFDFSGITREDVVILPAFGVTVADFERLRAHRLRAGRHHLRLGAERLEAGGELRPGRLYRDHPRQALPRGDQGHRQPGDPVSRRPIPGGAQHGGGPPGLRLHRGRRRPRGLRERFGRGTSRRVRFRAATWSGWDWPTRRPCCPGSRWRSREEFAPGDDAPLRRGGARRSTSARFDTICSATQERQDAVIALLEAPLDLMIVVGGYNSSNTCHLATLCQQRGVPDLSYRGRRRASIPRPARIRHQPVGTQGGDRRRRIGWTRRAPIGITAGASTPNNKIGETIARICEVAGVETRAAR